MMAEATKEFVEGLARRGHEPLLEHASGTVRLELENGRRKERWLVSIDNGDLSVSRGNGKADCTFAAPKELFEGIASGRVNAMAAILRGAMAIEGNWELLVLFQRLFPGPPRDASA
jgi:putative sterol carrier protein